MRRYLVVDDNRDFAENLAEIVRDQGDEVEVVESAAEALALARKLGFHAIVTDMKMPVMGGAELVHQLRRFDPGAAALIITAHVADSDIDAARQEGLLAVLPKPVPVARLLDLLAAARRDGLVALVEDDGRLADNLAEALRLRGFAAVTAASVLETERLGPVKPFCALVDLRVPGGPDGEAMRRLAAKYPGLPMIVVTGLHEPPALPHQGFFQKPFDTGQLLDMVERLHGTQAATPTGMKDAAKKSRLLVVDDNAGLVDNLCEILESAGYAVRGAGSCREALALAHEGFDVALVDLRLPDGDGTALAPRLKELAPDGEVVLLTGFATLESAMAAVRAGACAYLVKPCATQELLVTVEQAMRQVRLHGEKRELARRAQVAEKLAAVGTMTAGVSHEIRNPLNAAALQLSVLERRIQRLPREAQAALVDPLTLVKDEIRRLDHILEDFLQFARPREFVPRRVDLAPVLTKVLELLGGEAERRGIQVERDIAPVPAVAGDEERLRQVLVNLGLNALEAVQDRGRVRVSCVAEEADLDLPGAAPQVAIRFDDDGRGVPLDSRDRIFEPFFTTKAKGSGLGLSIVHAIVTQHRGSIAVEDSPDGGARFVLRLPQYR